MNYSAKSFITVAVIAHDSQFLLTTNNAKKHCLWGGGKRIVVKSWSNQYHVGKMMKGALYDHYRSLNLGYMVLISSPWSVLVSLFQFTHFKFKLLGGSTAPDIQ